MKKLALTIFFDVFILMLLGLIIVMSASSTYSVVKFDSVFALFESHLPKVLLSIVFMIGFCFIPYDIYRTLSKPAIVFTAILLLMTLFIAPDVKGASRWLNLGFTTIQPADIAKLVLIIHLAYLLTDKNNILESYRHGFLYLFIWVLIISGLIMLQPNISNGTVLIVISLIIMYVGGAKLKHILLSVLPFITLGGLVVLFHSHARARISSFIGNVIHGNDPNLQVKQALYSLGSGGVTGVGIGNSMQNNLFLPEAYGDFIFAILGEEMGFIGTTLVIAGFIIFFFAGVLVAKKAKDQFAQLLAFGITLSITYYAFVNIAVTTGLLPTTGLPLPFISYGGTSLFFLGISVGILINIALSNTIKKDTGSFIIPDRKPVSIAGV
ncbi:MAG TPA: putative peptidoglycan glycosyltransferase FtsW [Ignavibacteriaceae bacterium]